MTTTTVRPSRLHVVADHRPGALHVTSNSWMDEWLATLGPTSTLLAQRFAADLVDGDATYDTTILARGLGVAPSLLWRSIDRLDRFEVLTLVSTDVAVARLAMNPPRHTAVEAVSA